MGSNRVGPVESLGNVARGPKNSRMIHFVHGHGCGRIDEGQVVDGYEIAKDLDVTEGVAGMRANHRRITGEGDHRHVIAAVAGRILILNGGRHPMAIDNYMVAFVAIIVGDRIGADALDPMMMGIDALVMNGAPIDIAGSVRVAGYGIGGGVHVEVEEEGVGADTAVQRIVGVDQRFIGIELGQVGGLGNNWFSCVGARDEKIVARSPHQRIDTPVGINEVVAGAPVEAVGIVLAVAAAVDQLVFASHSHLQVVGAGAPHEVTAYSPLVDRHCH